MTRMHGYRRTGKFAEQKMNMLWWIYDNEYLWQVQWLDSWCMSAWLRIRGHCAEFLGKTLNFHSASLHPCVSGKKLNTEENSKNFMTNIDIWPINLQGACTLNHSVRDYDASLIRSVLSSLRCFKLETDLTCKADMWSHFGKVIIGDPDEGETVIPGQ